ncbi:MAG: DUF2809 domain-containing protein [Acidobacteria bacterium]|nr:DUF2809 domain-containing protein [Acidobacteriota bacterium]
MTALGVISRFVRFENAIFDKYLGDALYAILFYLLISILVSDLRAIIKATIVFILMVTFELFQLTRIPMALSQNENVLARFAAMLLGTVFSWVDIVAYLVGIVIAASVDMMKFENRK